MHHQPDGVAFDIVLLLHVACVVVGVVTTATAAATAGRLRRLVGSSRPCPRHCGATSARRQLGRAYRLRDPVFGFALVAMSQGAYALAHGWVSAGLAIFAAVVLVGEGVLWPAEQRVQVALAEADGSGRRPRGARARCSVLSRAAVAALALLVAGTVLMVAQP